MVEVCFEIDGEEICSGGEMLLAALILECVFWLLVLVGGWAGIKSWVRRRERVVIQKARDKWR